MPIISHVTLKVLIISQPIPELIEKYIQSQIKAARTRRKKLKEGTYDIDTIVDEVIEPGVKRTGPVFGTGSPSRKILREYARNYIKGLTKASKVDDLFLERLEHDAPNYEEKMRKWVIPYKGYGDKIPGLAQLARRWLIGDISVRPIILDHGGKIRLGGPEDIVKPELRPGFGRKFTGQITRLGKNMVKTHYYIETIQKANEKINQFVSSCARDEFVPFTPGGDSHVNFILVDEQLYSDIQIAVR